MTRAAIERDDFSVPAPDEFVMMFGCDIDFDDVTHTEGYTFTNNSKQISKMWIGTADRTFSLSITHDETEIVRIYDECLSRIKLDEERQMIEIWFGMKNLIQKVDFIVYPKFKVSLVRYRQNNSM